MCEKGEKVMYNVLLVDDEPRTIDALHKNVDWKRCGIRNVYKAMSMMEAIDLIQRENIKIMVCDIEMPNGSGLQLLEHLRERQTQISCIFVTCHPEFDYMRKAIQLKCYDYILKPINYEEFSRVLTELVNKLESLGERENIPDSQYKATFLDDSSAGTMREAETVLNERDVEREIKRYVREHMVDNITVTNIAEELHFNAQYLMRAFKSKTGMSIVEYITKARMDRAKNILDETNLPIKEISYLVGYSDYAYFTRVFRKEFGESPSQFRNKHRAEKENQDGKF